MFTPDEITAIALSLRVATLAVLCSLPPAIATVVSANTITAVATMVVASLTHTSDRQPAARVVVADLRRTVGVSHDAAQEYCCGEGRYISELHLDSPCV